MYQDHAQSRRYISTRIREGLDISGFITSVYSHFRYVYIDRMLLPGKRFIKLDLLENNIDGIIIVY